MQRNTKSLLHEINAFAKRQDKHHIVESKADNVIATVINFVQLIDEVYSAEDADDLKKRLFNSIKTNDPRKFTRGIRRIQNESK